MCQPSVSFYCRSVFRCVDYGILIYPFLSWRTFDLFPIWGQDQCHCAKHSGISFCANTGFAFHSGKYWGLWSLYFLLSEEDLIFAFIPEGCFCCIKNPEPLVLFFQQLISEAHDFSAFLMVHLVLTFLTTPLAVALCPEVVAFCILISYELQSEGEIDLTGSVHLDWPIPVL